MSEQTFAVDDDWGTGVAETEYPVLHSKQSVSKSVLRKRRKFAQKLQELSKSTVLPGDPAAASEKSQIQIATMLYHQRLHQNKKN